MVCPQVDEADNTIVPVEVPKASGADEMTKDNVPIEHEVNGDAEGVISGVSEGADSDPADQTLVEEVSVVQEIAVSGLSAFRLEFFLLLLDPFWVLSFSTLCLLCSFRPCCFRFPLFVLGRSGGVCVLISGFPIVSSILGCPRKGPRC